MSMRERVDGITTWWKDRRSLILLLPLLNGVVLLLSMHHVIHGWPWTVIMVGGGFLIIGIASYKRPGH